MTESTSHTQQLKDELKALADTLDEMLHSSVGKSKEEMEQLKAKADILLADARIKLKDSTDKAICQAKQAAARADQYVHEKPWTSVGVAAAAGLVIGVLLSRR